MGANFEFQHTEKQDELMRHILEAADTGTFIVFNDLYKRLSYRSTRQAVLCSLKFLTQHGFITKHLRGRHSMEIRPTSLAYNIFRGTPTV